MRSAHVPETKISNELETASVRRSLAKLRARWDAHAPAYPFCLTDEIDNGVTYGDFCVNFLLTQRSRRTRETSQEEPTPWAPSDAGPANAETRPQ